MQSALRARSSQPSWQQKHFLDFDSGLAAPFALKQGLAWISDVTKKLRRIATNNK